jgi:hypothetical protein
MLLIHKKITYNCTVLLRIFITIIVLSIEQLITIVFTYYTLCEN